MKSKSLSYRAIDYRSDEDCRILVRWNNDARIRHLFRPFRNEASALEADTIEALRERSLRDSPFRPIVDLFVLEDARVIGSASIIVAPPHQLTQSELTAWFGIVIGEESARGRGVGKKVMAELERLARGAGLTHAEIGTFEFNTAALEFYRSLGYVELSRIEAFTWWEGRRWADVRLVKRLC